MASLLKLFKEWRIKLSISRCLYALMRLQQAYFACYHPQKYLSKQLDAEKIIYQKRSRWLRHILKTRKLLARMKSVSAEWQIIFSNIDHLSEIIFSLHQLRFRVHDPAIYQICSYEMEALNKATTQAFKDAATILLWNKNAIPPITLLESIHSFEAISNRVLKVASPEPIVFLFFIQDLYALNDEINKLYEKIV